MPGDFGATLVGRIHGGRKLRRSNEHVRLEIVDPLVQPEVDSPGRVVRAGELMHLQRPTASPFEIRTGNVDLRARRLALINLLLEFEIGVGFE